MSVLLNPLLPKISFSTPGAGNNPGQTPDSSLVQLIKGVSLFTLSFLQILSRSISAVVRVCWMLSAFFVEIMTRW